MPRSWDIVSSLFDGAAKGLEDESSGAAGGKPAKNAKLAGIKHPRLLPAVKPHASTPMVCGAGMIAGAKFPAACSRVQSCKGVCLWEAYRAIVSLEKVKT